MQKICATVLLFFNAFFVVDGLYKAGAAPLDYLSLFTTVIIALGIGRIFSR